MGLGTKEIGYLSIFGTLRHLLPFAQFKKREKHPWMSVC